MISDESFPRTSITVGIRYYSEFFRSLDLNPNKSQYSVVLDLPSSTADRLKLAQSAWHHPQCQDEVKPASFRKYLTHRMRNTSIPYDREDSFWHFFTGLTIAGIIYGGLHMSAWDPHMSQTARLLWRISAIIVVSTGAMWLPVQMLIVTVNDRDRKVGDSLFIRIARRVAGPYAILVAVIYIAARIYLVVECFINVRRLPASTFEVPTWSQYFPHIA